jgi:osmotically-inducible protein OsmY
VDHLYWDDRVDASNVTVEVKNGEVFLSGTVPTYFSLLSAFGDASEIKGVRAVNNLLEIKGSDSQTVPNDKKILAIVENRLFTNQDMDVSEIDVSVDKGNVTVTGTVDAYWKKVLVEEMIAQERGVVGVRNQLAVVPTEVYPDQDIAKAVVAALERSALVDPAKVTVKVQDGIVTMSGWASNWAARENAYRVAINTSGVVDVVNNVAISNS